MKRRLCGALLLAATLVAGGRVAQAIEVTYGDGYVEKPNTRGDDDFINLGYGIDPIPAKSPVVRFNEWRDFRWKMRAQKMQRRQAEQPQVAPQSKWEQIPAGEQSAPSGVEAKRPAQPRPSSRRASQTRPAPRAF
jgi:hypothetical protein